MFKITLKAARVNAGLTIKQAAARLGIGKDKLMAWEKDPGRVEVRYQKVISDAYKAPVDVIFFGS